MPLFLCPRFRYFGCTFIKYALDLSFLRAYSQYQGNDNHIGNFNGLVTKTEIVNKISYCEITAFIINCFWASIEIYLLFYCLYVIKYQCNIIILRIINNKYIEKKNLFIKKECIFAYRINQNS